MGRVKQWAREELEESLARDEKQMSLNLCHTQGSTKEYQVMNGLEDTDQAWAEYNKEFNDWLDNYLGVGSHG